MEQNACLWGKALPLWISKENGGENQYAEFLHLFDTTETAAKLRISCDSRAAIFLNGELVGLAIYDGTDHADFYEEFELGEFLKEGKNELKAVVFYQGVSSSNYTLGQPYLLFTVQCADGTWITGSDESTLCRRNRKYQNGPVEKNQMGFVWHYDDTVPDEEWRSAVCTAPISKEFRKRPILRQEMKKRLDMKLVREWEENGTICKILDCREESSGLLELEIETEIPVEIFVEWGEHLADGKVRSHIGSRNFITSYKCETGKRKFTHYFHRLGLRYLQLCVKPEGKGKTELVYAGIRPLEYPVQEKGKIKIEDELHQKIYDIAVRTLNLCMHEHYEDCPWREQALYAMDSVNQALCGYYCFGEYDFAAASLELLGEGLEEDGYLELHTPGKDAIKIPYFTFMWVMGMCDYVRYSGDVSFIKKHWNCITKVVDSRLAEIQDNLLPTQTGTLYWNFYEWNDLLDGAPTYRNWELEERRDAPYIMNFLMMLDTVEAMGRRIGEESYAEKLARTKMNMQEACHKLFWDEEKKAYLTFAYPENNGFAARKGEFAELTQAWAVLSGVAQGSEKEAILEKLAAGSGDLVPCTLSMIRFKYEALLRQPEKYGQLVFENIKQIWGNMVKKGATSFWETEDGEAAFLGAGSLCHGWSAMPVYFYYAYLLGIVPDENGKEEMKVCPVPVGLQAKGSVTMLDGTVIKSEIR